MVERFDLQSDRDTREPTEFCGSPRSVDSGVVMNIAEGKKDSPNRASPGKEKSHVKRSPSKKVRPTTVKQAPPSAREGWARQGEGGQHHWLIPLCPRAALHGSASYASYVSFRNDPSHAVTARFGHRNVVLKNSSLD